ncbi:hypothetical protein ACLMJK_007606 [Lecanora helva]
MDDAMQEPFDFDAFVNWPSEPEDLVPDEVEESVSWTDQITTNPLGKDSNDDHQSITAGAFNVQQPHGKVTNQSDLKNGVPITSMFNTFDRIPLPSPYGGVSPIVRESHEQLCKTNDIANHIFKKGCACMCCLEIGDGRHVSEDELPCRILGCDKTFSNESHYGSWKHLRQHERGHFRAGENYKCLHSGCVFKTNGSMLTQWAVLRRHHARKHCDLARQHACPHFGCNRKGENAFKRADNLKTHIFEVHQGGKRVRGANSNKKSRTGDSTSEISVTEK